MSDQKERTELRLDPDLKMQLVADARKLGISLNEYCEMKLKKQYVTMVAMVGDAGEFMEGLKREIDNKRQSINGIPSYTEGGTINTKK